MLLRMKHRGACGCEDNTGDGAGIMTAIPHEMYQNIIREEGHSFILPNPGQYATGLVFLDTDSTKVYIVYNRDLVSYAAIYYYNCT